MNEINMHAWNQYASMKYIFWKVLARDFAFKASTKYVEVKDKFWDWGILNKVKSIFDFKSVVPSLYKIRGYSRQVKRFIKVKL